MQAAPGTGAPKHQRRLGLEEQGGALATPPFHSALDPAGLLRRGGVGRAFPQAADPSLDDCPCPLLLRWAAGPPRARPPAWTWWGGTGQATPGPLGTAHHGSPRPPFCISSPRPTSHRRGVCPWLPSAAGSALRAGVHPGASHRPTADRAFQPPPSRVPNAATDLATVPAPLPYPPRSTSPPAPSPSTIPATCQHHRAGPQPPPPRLRHRREPETRGCATPRGRAGEVRASGPSGTPLPRGGSAGGGTKAELQGFSGRRPGTEGRTRGAAAGAVWRGGRAPGAARSGRWRSGRGSAEGRGAALQEGGRGRCDWRGRGLPQWARRAWLGVAGGARTGATESEGEGNGLDGGGRGACCRRGLRQERGGVASRQRRGPWERGEVGGRMGAVRTGPDGAHTETARGLRWGRRWGRPD